MLLFLDAGWIGAIASTAALVLTAAIFLMTRKRKSLSYEVLSTYPLISINDEIRGRLQILLDKEPVENVHLLLIRFVNDGNVPVAAADYETPLTLRFHGKSNILSAEHVSSRSVDLSPPIKIKDKDVVFEPILMNGGDSFTTKVLIGQFRDGFDVSARILGVRRVQLAAKRDRRGRLNLIGNVSLAIAVVVALAGAGYYGYRWWSSSPPSFLRPYEPLTIRSLTSDQYVVPGHETLKIRAILTGSDFGYGSDDPGKTSLTYQWSAERGMIVSTPNTEEVEYYSPTQVGPDKVTLRVNDNKGHTATKSVSLQVVEQRLYVVGPKPTP